MHPLSTPLSTSRGLSGSAWRMLPPGGAPLHLYDMARALYGRGGRQEASRALHRKFHERFGVPHVFFAGSGREALALLFTALRRETPGRDCILLPAYVSWSVPSAVARAGCRILLYDVEPCTLAPRPESLASILSQPALAERILAVMACHLFGYPFDPAPLRELCRKTGAVLVDDAAQTMGARVGEAHAGCMGDVGLFSLSRGKNITAVDGGVLLTHRDDLAGMLEPLFSERAAPGLSRRETTPVYTRAEALAHNTAILLKGCALAVLRHPAVYRLPASLPWLKLGESLFEPGFQGAPFGALQARLARYALDGLDKANATRAARAALYSTSLSAGCGLRPITPALGATPVYPRYPVLPEQAGGPGFHSSPPTPGHEAFPPGTPVNTQSRRLGISQGFPLPVHAIPGISPYLACQENIHPGAEYLARHLFTLPTHTQTTEADCAAALSHALSIYSGSGGAHPAAAMGVKA